MPVALPEAGLTTGTSFFFFFKVCYEICIT